MTTTNKTTKGGPGSPEVIEVIDILSSPPQSPAGGKRKASDKSHDQPKSGKKAKGSSVVELNGRKVIFHQTPYERPQIPRRRLLELQMDLLDAKEEGKPMSELPDKFWDLIVLVGHELTSPNEAAFIKAIKTELLKGGDGDILSTDLLVAPVKQLFALKQYGFLGSDLSIAQSRLPASLQIRCWEANDVEKYFPDESVAKLLERRGERERARDECVRLAADLDDTEKHDLVKGDKVKDDGPTPVAKLKQATLRSRDITPTASSSHQQTASPTKRTKVAADDDEERRKQEEKEAKLAEREERKREAEEKRKEAEEKKAEREAERKAKQAAKQAEMDEKKAEEKKKNDARKKQQGFFDSFMKKPVAAVAAKSSSTKRRATLLTEPSSSNDGRSDFEKNFPAPERKNNVKWMPINNFDIASSSKNSESVAGWTPRDFINDHLSRHKLTTRTPRAKTPRGLKTGLPYGSVAEMYAEYQSASDPRLVRRRLLNIDRYPKKIIAFDQQARPPYEGTFTKPSVVVGPRTPFERDPLFDYSYDSGDDWDDDEGGEEVEGVEQDAEADEDMSDDNQEDEFDDWLDNEEDPLFKPDANGDVPMLDLTTTPPPNASPLRGATKDKKRIPVKRIHKLNQDCQGPFWETEIGKHPSEEWNPYRIQLLNDAPSSLDPFKYESSEPPPLFKATFTDTAVGMQVGIKCLLGTEQASAPKPTSATSAPAAAAAVPLGDASSTANTPGSRARPAQKIAFSESQLAELLAKIDNSSKIQSDLVLELRGLFPGITKAAIEAKVREVASREGKGKEARWRVKAEAWKSAGLEPPARGLLGVFIDRTSS